MGNTDETLPESVASLEPKVTEEEIKYDDTSNTAKGEEESETAALVGCTTLVCCDLTDC
jgi:hypothetical protein